MNLTWAHHPGGQFARSATDAVYFVNDGTSTLNLLHERIHQKGARERTA
jgi:hypothetical protein